MSALVSVSPNAGMIRENPLAWPPSRMVAFQSMSRSSVVGRKR
jgi:hypothetical protein